MNINGLYQDGLPWVTVPESKNSTMLAFMAFAFESPVLLIMPLTQIVLPLIQIKA
jgi:hypothetical protein